MLARYKFLHYFVLSLLSLQILTWCLLQKHFGAVVSANPSKAGLCLLSCSFPRQEIFTHTASTAFLSTKVTGYRVTARESCQNAGVNLRWTSTPSRESTVVTLLVASCNRKRTTTLVVNSNQPCSLPYLNT